MQVNMLFIGMNCKEILILVFEKTLTQLSADLKSLIGSNFPRLETDNEVLGKNGTPACTICPYFFIVTVSLFGV